jgi:predicted phage terminase large subunit-like protein
MTPEMRALLRRDFSSFVARCFYELYPTAKLSSAPYVDLIADRLTKCMTGEIRRLMIWLPPRHLKSLCASIAFPAWLLGHRPDVQIMCVSYGQDLADDFARRTRQIMLSPWYQEIFITRLDRQAVHDFMTRQGGCRFATSVGGATTGRGADFIVIDDALKPEEAMSDVARKAVNNWYDNTLQSRINQKKTGRIILVGQRLHQDDLAGHALALEQDGWNVLKLAAIADEDEPYQIGGLADHEYVRKAGNVLDEEREDRAMLETIRRRMGDYNFSAQYQQCPVPVGGAMVKRDWLRYYEASELPDDCIKVASWDTANKVGELNDFSVGTIWGVVQDRYYLIDVIRERLNYPDLKKRVREVAEKYRVTIILIEDRASGTQLIQDLMNDGVCGVTAYKPPTGADKSMRLHTQTATFANGQVLLPSDAPWLSEYISELLSFPGAKHDDQVDSTTQALEYLQNDRALLVWYRLS